LLRAVQGDAPFGIKRRQPSTEVLPSSK
jgi:hypothetical protein